MLFLIKLNSDQNVRILFDIQIEFYCMEIIRVNLVKDNIAFELNKYDDLGRFQVFFYT